MKEYTKNQVHEVACAFNEHKIIALPTDTVYGVGVKYGDLEDLERLKRAKHRPETKPIPMMVSNVEQMKQVALVDERIEKIESIINEVKTEVECVSELMSGISEASGTVQKNIASLSSISEETLALSEESSNISFKNLEKIQVLEAISDRINKLMNNLEKSFEK